MQRITIGGAAPDYFGNRVVSSGLDWQKFGPSSSKDRTYKNGFALITLTSDGSKWVAPPKGTNVLSVTDASNNAQIEFSEGELSSSAQAANVDQIFQLTAANAIKFNAATNPCKVTLKINSATGTFSGSFKMTDPNPAGGKAVSRSVPFSGILLKHRNNGWGYFLLPKLPNPSTVPPTTSKNSDILSGQVWIGPNP